MAKKSTPTGPDEFQKWYLLHPEDIVGLNDEAKQQLWPEQLAKLKLESPDINGDQLTSLNKPEAPAPYVYDQSGSSLTTEETDENGTKNSVEPPNESKTADPLMGPSNFPEGGKLTDIGEGTPQGVFSTPRAGSRVWIFFHGGDIQRPVYFAQSIPPTEYQNFHGNPEPQAGENNNSLQPTVIDPLNGKENVIPNTTDNTEQPTRSINKNALQTYTGSLNSQISQVDQAAVDELNALKQEPPTPPATGWTQVTTNLETGRPNFTIE